MLSDSLFEMRRALAAGIHQEAVAGLELTLRAYELEARNMEERIQLLSGRPHVPIELVTSATPVIDISVAGGRVS